MSNVPMFSHPPVTNDSGMPAAPLQQAGAGTAGEVNERYHYLLSQGATQLDLVFDLPTQTGYDSNHPLAKGRVGKAGVAIDSIEDMQLLLQGIELEKVPVTMTINATGFILLALYAAVAKLRGADLSALRGLMRNDGSAGHGGCIYPPQPSMRIAEDLFEWCSRELPGWTIVQASGDERCKAETTAEKNDTPIFETDDEAGQLQTERIESLRRRRDPAKIDRLLQALIDAAAGDENVMPFVLEAVENRVTVGEIADTLREVFGECR